MSTDADIITVLRVEGLKWRIDCQYCVHRFWGNTKPRAIEWMTDHVDRRHSGKYGGDTKAIRRPMKLDTPVREMY